MATDDRYALLYNKKPLPFDQLGPKFLTYLINNFRQLSQDTFGRDTALLNSVPVTASTANNKIDVAKLTTISAVTGTGRHISTSSPADSRLQGIKIPPNAGVIYSVAIEQGDVEDGIETNPRTGKFEYLYMLESMGRVTNPTQVTVSSGTLIVNVNSLVESGDDHSGRQVRIWLKSAENGGPGPQSASASVAIQTLTITFSTPNNTITVPNLMGQTSPSSNQADYIVQLIGPTVKRQTTEDLRSTNGAFFLAAVTSVATGNVIPGGNIDTSSQVLSPLTMSDIAPQLSDLQLMASLTQRPSVVSGFNTSGNAGLTFNVASGVGYLNGTKRTPAAVARTLTDNTTNYLYVDSADSITKTTTTLATALAGANLLLYRATTSGGAITLTEDLRRFLTTTSGRTSYTVGPVNCDFTSLEAAFAWAALDRQSPGVGEPVEIVLHGSVTLTRQIAISFPVVVRGAISDASALVGGPLCQITMAGGIVAFNCSATVPNVVFKDLNIVFPNVASTAFLTFTGNTGADGWIFDNLSFNITGGSQFNVGNPFLIQPSGQVFGWRWNNCAFIANANFTNATPWFSLGNGTFNFIFTNCRFANNPGVGVGNSNVQGILFDGTLAGRHRVDGCDFATWRNSTILTRTAVDEVRILNNRFDHESGANNVAGISLASDGECYIENNIWNNCSNGQDAIIRSSTISGHGGGAITVNGNRFKGFANNGGATQPVIKIDSGTPDSIHKITNNSLKAGLLTTSGVLIRCDQSYCRIEGNDIDASPGASAGNGAPTMSGIQVGLNGGAIGAIVRGNRIRNCGSNASPNSTIVTGPQSIVDGNMFFNCRGFAIVESSGGVSGGGGIWCNNIIADTDSAATNAGILVATSNTDGNIVTGNIINNSGTTPGLNATGATTNVHRVGNNRQAVAPVVVDSGSIKNNQGFLNAALYVNQSFDPPSQSWAVGITEQTQIANKSYPLAGHQPRSVTLAAAVSGVQAGLRLGFTDGTTSDLFNTTASPVQTDYFTPGNLTVPNGTSIIYIMFIVKNTNGSPTTADLGASSYQGTMFA